MKDADKRSVKVLVEMDPSAVWELLEKHQAPSIIEQEDRKSLEYFSQLTCPYPNCGNGVFRKVNERQLFKPDGVIPNYLACCKGCGCEFEPYTKLIVRGQGPGRVG